MPFQKDCETEHVHSTSLITATTSYSSKEVLTYILNAMEALKKDLLKKKNLEDIITDYQSIFLPHFSNDDPVIQQFIDEAYIRLRIEIAKLSLY